MGRGTFVPVPPFWGLASGPRVSWSRRAEPKEAVMNGVIYLVGLIVVVLFILSFLGLR